TLRRGGIVVAMSGGVDSSVCAALAVEAVGPGHVLGLGLPERESDAQSLALARDWAGRLAIQFVVEDVTALLEACGGYERRDAAVRRLVPEYGPGWRSKLVLEGGGLDSDRLNVCSLAVQAPGQALRKVRLPARELREIVAATNFKQRIRTMLAYHHADRLNYAVLGTPNRLEYDQGFFVKGGDGLADVKPIAHLYKSQVYQLAESLGVPVLIRARTPTTVRLSVIDLARGAQPMTNEDGSVFLVYNGESFNHLALRGELEARGHLFRTRSDTEVVVHAYEQWGERMLERLNGQFAFAIY